MWLICVHQQTAKYVKYFHSLQLVKSHTLTAESSSIVLEYWSYFGLSYREGLGTSSFILIIAKENVYRKKERQHCTVEPRFNELPRD